MKKVHEKNNFTGVYLPTLDVIHVGLFIATSQKARQIIAPTEQNSVEVSSKKDEITFFSGL